MQSERENTWPQPLNTPNGILSGQKHSKSTLHLSPPETTKTSCWLTQPVEIWYTHTHTHTCTCSARTTWMHASPLPSLSARSPSVMQGVRDGIKWETERGWRRRRGGDESRLWGEEERQQVVVGCSTDSFSHEVLFTSVLQEVSLPSSGVPSGLSQLLCALVWCKAPQVLPSLCQSLSPSHVEACPTKHYVNVIRSVKPESCLLFSFYPPSCYFHLFAPPPGSEQSSLAIQIGSSVTVCLCICMCNLRVRERVGECEGADGEVGEWGRWWEDGKNVSEAVLGKGYI